MDESVVGRAIVTGAATGIGAATVAALLDAGLEVVGCYRSSPPPEDLADRCAWVPCDARDRASVESAFDDAARSLGGLDVLVAAAGHWSPGTPETLTLDELGGTLNSNLRSTVLTNQAAFRRMRDHGGRIINLGSAEANRGNAIAPAYAAAKAAVQAWTRSAALAWGGYDITVNAVAPAMQTPGADRLWAHLGAEEAAARRASYEKLIPVGGALGDPYRDLGPVIAFLAGSGSRFVTGQTIAVNGGLMMLGA